MANAHIMVAKVAQGIAEELYEVCMSNNDLYAYWKAMCPELEKPLLQKRFVELMVPHLLDAAVATLAKMLTGAASDVLKDQIADALIKDKALNRKPPIPQRSQITIN